MKSLTEIIKKNMHGKVKKGNVVEVASESCRLRGNGYNLFWRVYNQTMIVYEGVIGYCKNYATQDTTLVKSLREEFGFVRLSVDGRKISEEAIQ